MKAKLVVNTLSVLLVGVCSGVANAGQWTFTLPDDFEPCTVTSGTFSRSMVTTGYEAGDLPGDDDTGSFHAEWVPDPNNPTELPPMQQLNAGFTLSGGDMVAGAPVGLQYAGGELDFELTYSGPNINTANPGHWEGVESVAQGTVTNTVDAMNESNWIDMNPENNGQALEIDVSMSAYIFGEYEIYDEWTNDEIPVTLDIPSFTFASKGGNRAKP